MSDRPLDAPARSLIDRFPRGLRPYLSLSRIDRPVGIWLLFLPCVIGQCFGRIGIGFGLFDAILAGGFLIGAIAMRGAGCAYNDILDRDIDAKVERTKARPLPSGQISVKQAWIWIAVQMAIGFGVWLTLPPLAKWIALGAIPLVAIYPLMKRVTFWPQAWLGLTFNWGALVAYASVAGRMDWSILVLYVGLVAWTIAYDTIYALQDREDDELVGVKSTARLFGDLWFGPVRGFYAAFFLAAFLALMLHPLGGFSGAFAFGLWLVLLMTYVTRGLLVSIDAGDAQSALMGFKANVSLGVAFALGLFVIAASAHFGAFA